MECLICYKVYFKGQSHESTADPHFDISATISKLFDISTSSWVTDIDTFGPLSICPGCTEKLGQVHRMLQELDQIQLNLKRIKSEVFADLIKSEETSQQNGFELKERSKIIQEICSKQNIMEKSSTISDAVTGSLFDVDVKMFGPESYDKNIKTIESILDDFEVSDVPRLSPEPNDENIKTRLDDHIESIDNDNDEDLNRPNPALQLKNLQIILEPLPILGPFSEGDSFNVKDRAIVNFIQRDKSRIRMRKSLEINVIKTGNNKHTLRKRKKTSDTNSNSILSNRRKIQKLTQAKSKKKPKKIKHCSICNITFLDNTRYVAHHNRVHLGVRAFQCDKCPKNYYSKDHLNMHLKLSHPVEERSFQCDKCPKNFYTEKGLNVHSKMHGIYGLCNGDQERLTDLIKHCSICNLTFNKTESYVTHYNKIHKGERPFQCDKCPKNYYVKYELQYHLKFVHGNGERPYQCDKCPKNFVFKKNLTVHMKRHGVGNGVLQCTICSTFWPSRRLLNNHMSIVHFLEKSWFCDSCPESFASNRSLQVHILAHHLGLKSKCPQCDKTFNSSSGVAFHVKRIHEKVLRFICPVENCGRKFFSPSELKNHNNVAHLKIPRYYCDKCPDKKFYKKGPLDEHYFAKHAAESEKQYRCKYCQKAFAVKKYLHRHLRLHAGIRDHICHICGESYGMKSSLDFHISTKHLGVDKHLTDNLKKRRKPKSRRIRVPIIPEVMDLDELNELKNQKTYNY